MIEITIPYKKILSVNNYLMPVKQKKRVKTKSGNTITKEVIRNIKTPSARKQSDRVEEYVRFNYGRILEDNRKLFDSKKFIWIWHFNICNVNNRDLTNLKKIQEDAVVKAIKYILGDKSYDDTDVFFDFSYKTLSPKDSESITLNIYSVDELKNLNTLIKVSKQIVKSIRH